jgi:hypothetical protein
LASGVLILVHTRLNVIEAWAFAKQLAALVPRVGPDSILVVSNQAEARPAREILYHPRSEKPCHVVTADLSNGSAQHRLATSVPIVKFSERLQRAFPALHESLTGLCLSI